jgi:hypothetical protein
MFPWALRRSLRHHIDHSMVGSTSADRHCLLGSRCGLDARPGMTVISVEGSMLLLNRPGRRALTTY